MSRILLFNQYYPPDTSATAAIALDAARALVRAGHSVHVIAGRPSYRPTQRHPWRWTTRTEEDGVLVERVGSCAFHRSRMAHRVLNYLSYLGLALVSGLRRKADLVIAMTDPPIVAIVGALVAAFRRIPFVYNIRDLHPDVALATGLIGGGPFVRLWEALHRWALRRARRIIVLGTDMRERVASKGIDEVSIAVVRDGARPIGSPCDPDHPLVRRIRDGFRLTVVHAGNLGVAGAWDSLLEAAQRLEREAVGFVFVGDGALACQLRDRARTHGNVRFIEPRPASEVPHVLAAGDLQLVTLRPGLEGLVVPSKLYPILAAGRPVMAIVPDGSDVARVVGDSGCGWVVDPSDVEGIVATVRDVLADPALLVRCAVAATAAAGQFDRDALLRRFVFEIEDVLGRSPGEAVSAA